MIKRYKTKADKRKARVRHALTKVKHPRPRLVVTRTNQHIYAQIVDLEGKTIVASSDAMLSSKKKQTKTEAATAVGTDIGAKAKKAKVTQVTFDRSYYKYHGRVKALAEAARSAGLEF